MKILFSNPPWWDVDLKTQQLLIGVRDSGDSLRVQGFFDASGGLTGNLSGIEFANGDFIDSAGLAELVALGDAARDRGQFREADALYARAIEREPGAAAAHVGRGDLYYYWQRYPEAEASYRAGYATGWYNNGK